MRAATSVEPPAAKGTTSRTARDGHLSADAGGRRCCCAAADRAPTSGGMTLSESARARRRMRM
jgi:hypothetical protein